MVCRVGKPIVKQSPTRGEVGRFRRELEVEPQLIVLLVAESISRPRAPLYLPTPRPPQKGSGLAGQAVEVNVDDAIFTVA